jgi:hypothetical protein
MVNVCSDVSAEQLAACSAAQNLVQVDVGIGSTEKEELVRNTRRLEGVLSTEGYSEG